ncbi:hypothetical protein QE152_g23283 [Popillia japonica]|uniref:Gustatory receptor n=1 Tax=Popillia japonica TaxID=7064 RepID=A0AAW1KI68_POPJA
MNSLFSHQLKFNRNIWLMRLFVISPLEKNSTLTRIQGAFILLVILAIFGYELSGRLNTTLTAQLNTCFRAIAIGTLNKIIVVVCNVIVTLPPLFFSEEITKDVLEEVDNIDTMLSKYRKIKNGVKSYNLYLVILHLVFIIFLINNVNYWFENSNHYSKYYFWYQFYRYRLGMLALYVFSLIQSLHQKISDINTILTEELEQTFRKDLDSKLFKHLESVVQDMSDTFAKFTNLILLLGVTRNGFILKNGT